MRSLEFFRANARWLITGYLIALGSSFGQTFFIAIFAEPFRVEFDLSHGDFGAIYMAATLTSAAVLLRIGVAADFAAERVVLATVMIGFALVCLGVSVVDSALMLGVLIFGLRLTGQGMMSLLSQAYMARWFNQNRGRALAFASFGYPSGEALLPLTAVALMAAIGWRETWMAAAAALLLFFLPVLWLLVGRNRSPRHRADTVEAVGLGGRAWTRVEVTRHGLFWLMLPGVSAQSFILTSVFFLPQHIADIKGWQLTDITASYSVYAAMVVLGSLGFGVRVDRLGAVACLSMYQLPMIVGLVGFYFVGTVELYWLVMALFGLTAGASQPVHSAIWAELYGSRHIGAVKSMAHASMVLASAAGPGLVGALIDRGVGFEVQCLWMAGAALGTTLGFILIRRSIARRWPAPAS